jgi:hypothetical protein
VKGQQQSMGPFTNFDTYSDANRNRRPSWCDWFDSVTNPNGIAYPDHKPDSFAHRWAKPATG